MRLNLNRATCTVAILAMATTMTLACDDDDIQSSTDASVNDSGTGDAGTVALSDPQISHVMLTANTGEIEQGNIALTPGKAQSAEVKAYAQMMVTEHSLANTTLTALNSTAGITPITNPVSQMLLTQNQMDKTALMAATGLEFDRTYMQKQLAAHQKVLMLLDQQLIRQAVNLGLSAYLKGIRENVNKHREDAARILGGLASPPDGGTSDAGSGDAGDAS